MKVLKNLFKINVSFQKTTFMHVQYIGIVKGTNIAHHAKKTVDLDHSWIRNWRWPDHLFCLPIPYPIVLCYLWKASVTGREIPLD